MIRYSEIENELGVKTLLTDEMQAALEDWYATGIEGRPLDYNPDTMAMGWPALICGELARLTTLELDAKVEGSPRADWINEKMQRVLSPRRKRVLSLALCLGSGVWKPYQSGEKIGVSFIPATGYYPISHNEDGELTEAVFVDQIRDSENYFNRLEWMHVLNGPEDYHDRERDMLEEMDVGVAPDYPCVQVISRAYRSSTKDTLGSRITLDSRPEWADIEPIAYLQGLEKLPVGYFVTPIINTIDPTSELGAAVFSPARRQIIDADQQYTRLDWEYEAGEMAVDVDENYLKPTSAASGMPDDYARERFGVPAAALGRTAPKHKERMFRGIDVNTGITQSAPFYQVFAPSLRDGNYLSGLNQYIRNIESHVGLAFGTFSQGTETEKTATEIMNSRQKSYALVSDLQAALEQALRELVDALNWWADQIEGVPPAGEISASFHWDDSIIIDRMTEMSQWQQEVAMGLRSKSEYRQHFFGEDEATATQAIAAVREEAMAADILQGVLTGGNQAQPQTGKQKPKKQA